MAKTPNPKTDDTETTTDPAAPAQEPTKVVTIEEQGIGANDPYPTGKPAEPEVK